MKFARGGKVMGVMKKLFFQEGLSSESENFLNAKEWVRVNRWFLFILIIIASISMIMIVSNVRGINLLLVEIHSLEKKELEVRNVNERLVSQIIALESAERIISIAEQNIGMIRSEIAPKVLK
jgi:cell division protein FtsL